jgi:Uma2 family endonuclease
MVLSFRHEMLNRILASIVEVCAEEMGIDIVNAGSTTFKREDLQRGFEPDTGFYIQNAGQVRGKAEIDPTVDPAPDLVIEIDLSHSSLDKHPIYAAVGVAEIWCYDGSRLKLLQRTGDSYQPISSSAVFAGLTSAVIEQFIEHGQSAKRIEWLQKMRRAIRDL